MSVDLMSICSFDSYPMLARKRQQNLLKEKLLSKMLHIRVGVISLSENNINTWGIKQGPMLIFKVNFFS
jgi:hypothetical protein